MTHQSSIHPQSSAASAVPAQVNSVQAPKRLRLAPIGPVRLLTVDARPEVLAHLLRLSDDDLRMRFMRCMPVASIEAHAASLDFDAAIRLGIRRHGRLVAMAEGIIFGPHGETMMEVAFSTDRVWRRRGLARALGHAIAQIAARRGVVRIVANCDARNRPVKSLLRAFEAVIECEDGEVSASWVPAQRAHAADFAFEHFVCSAEDQTAQRPIGDAATRGRLRAPAGAGARHGAAGRDDRIGVHRRDATPFGQRRHGRGNERRSAPHWPGAAGSRPAHPRHVAVAGRPATGGRRRCRGRRSRQHRDGECRHGSRWRRPFRRGTGAKA